MVLDIEAILEAEDIADLVVGAVDVDIAEVVAEDTIPEDIDRHLEVDHINQD